MWKELLLWELEWGEKVVMDDGGTGVVGDEVLFDLP